jgi:hypothetical protein
MESLFKLTKMSSYRNRIEESMFFYDNHLFV